MSNPIEYAINAVEQAGSSTDPYAHGYEKKRQALLDAVAALRRERDEAREALAWSNAIIVAQQELLDGKAADQVELREMLREAQVSLAAKNTAMRESREYFAAAVIQRDKLEAELAGLRGQM